MRLQDNVICDKCVCTMCDSERLPGYTQCAKHRCKIDGCKRGAIRGTTCGRHV